jgi:CRP/FNR family transcriptional regulator
MKLIPDFLKIAPPAVRDRFAEGAHSIALPDGKEILSPGQTCEVMPFVVTGCIRVYLLGHDGREITLYRVEGGHGCVLSASCILGGIAFPASAVVEAAATGCAVPASEFRDWVNEEPYWREYVFRMIGERMATVLGRFEEAAFERLEIRLARQFLRRIQDGEVVLRTTHQGLADDLGSSREVVSRVLERWQSAGWVRLHRGAIEIHRGAEIEGIAGLL